MFFKHLALTSAAALAYPALSPLEAHAGVGSHPEGQTASTQKPDGAHNPSAAPSTVINVKDYGAKGDGTTDDTENIQRAMRSNSLIFFPAGNYLVSKGIRLVSLQNVHICATGATLTNNTLTNHLFEIHDCEFVTVTGGKYTRSETPSASWPSDRHCFYFSDCRDVIIQDVLIDGSPGMGIAIGTAINVKALNNTIRNTTRDGIYSHYSLNVLYSGNFLENIADDALSMHDYGVKADKQAILARGYPQGGNSIITNNRIRNAAGGIASIGLQALSITDNIIDHTIGCGIKVSNIAEAYQGPDAQAQDVLISGNIISYACQAHLNILGKERANYNQGGAGKAALTVGSFDARAQYAVGTRRLSNITVTGNMVNYSAANAYFLNNTDGLVFSNNSARDCNMSPFPPYTGYIVECWSCTDVCAFNNRVADGGTPPTAIAAYRVRDVTGSIGGWIGPGYVVYPGSKSKPKVLY